MSRVLTCGVLVTDGAHVLIGHATRSPRWDIPKGGANPGEVAETTARRELWEETGLIAPPTLEALGEFPYLPAKDLSLFVWTVPVMPEVATLVCRSTFVAGGRTYPEFDRFSTPPWPDALAKLGASMVAVLRPILSRRAWGPQ